LLSCISMSSSSNNTDKTPHNNKPKSFAKFTAQSDGFEESTVLGLGNDETAQNNYFCESEDPNQFLGDAGASTMSIDLLMTNKIELKNNKNLNQMIEMLKYGIMEKLHACEPMKNEILILCQRNHHQMEHLDRTDENKIKLIKEIVNQVLAEWNLINEQCRRKMNKLENFRLKVAELDLKLNHVRENLLKWEGYLDQEMLRGFDLTNYAQVLSKRSDLENLLEMIKRKDQETESLLKQCMYANRSYFNSNKHNQFLIVNLKTRWSNLKAVVKGKIFKLNHVWVYLCDLNDQMEKFYIILNRTEVFYQNVLLSERKNSNKASSSPSRKVDGSSRANNVLRSIEDVYLTIKDDYKLIKYLNESYVNFAKFVGNLDACDCLETIKRKLLTINSRWDSLHNEIAIKINSVNLNLNFLFKLK
jgi:hypothetical protein